MCIAFVLCGVRCVIIWKRECLKVWRQKAWVCKCIVSVWMRDCKVKCHQILKLGLGHFNCCYFIFDIIIWPFHSHLNLGLHVLRLDLHSPFQLSLCLTPSDTQILINGLGNWSSVEIHAMIFKLSLLVWLQVSNQICILIGLKPTRWKLNASVRGKNTTRVSENKVLLTACGFTREETKVDKENGMDELRKLKSSRNIITEIELRRIILEGQHV